MHKNNDKLGIQSGKSRGGGNMNSKRKNTTLIAIIGVVAVMIILAAGSVWMGRNATRDTENAVRSVSLLYLDELAGRREQVVAKNLEDRIQDMETALDLIEPDDLSDKEHMQNYQTKMKRLFSLERFGFVNREGLVYTSTGYAYDIDTYPFDYKTIKEAEISVMGLGTKDKKVIIAMPIQGVALDGDELTVAFMQIDMDEMLSGVSMQSQEEGTTFSNIYTKTGVALSNAVLGGLAEEDNLLEALEKADYETGYSYEQVLQDFEKGNRGETSFTYNGIKETLAYVPVEDTDWMLTYLIRESVINAQISTISKGIILRSIIQSLVTIAILVGVFIYVILQNRKNARLQIEKETADAESRVKQEELEQRLALQEQLLEEERQRKQQTEMITALASDYWSVYYLELDTDDGICYQSHSDITDGFKVGERFKYLASVTSYAKRYVSEEYLEEFLKFIQPENIKKELKEHHTISYTYMVKRHEHETYEMVRFAGVHHPGEKADAEINAVGACFTDVDAETRRNIEQQQALSDALEVAEDANRAKTAFLSNMSHEIRTPMNAIIGLDNIALNDPETPEKTKDYLQKIGDSADHLLGLINDILDMSRIESGRMTLKNEEFSFPKLLEAINTMFSGQCSQHGLEYHCHIKGQVDDYYIGDNMKLRQVLINILGNAVKFTPEGGTVELSVERVAQFEGQSTLRFKIADTGIGMNKEFLPHIFDAFAQEDSSTTNKFGSSGLGLAITKSIVEMMNGDIEVESEKGKGSTFTVTVTLSDSTHSGAEEASGEVEPQEMCVLIVDDDPVACEHAKLVLEKVGIASEIAESGAEAIQMVELHHARRDPYNLILVDWQMPEMDGVETTRRIREIVGHESAIIILTAYRWDDVLEEALEAGVDSFLPKPLFAATVLEEFKSAMIRKGVAFKKEQNKADLTNRRILLAEDVPINAEIIQMVLEARQMQVELAENGKLAVEKFASHEAGYYDAILMDMRMPEMDGLEATQTIRAMDREDVKEIPIIALTANAFDEDVQRSMQAGLNAHLTKPVQPELLYETLESLIK